MKSKLAVAIMFVVFLAGCGSSEGPGRPATDRGSGASTSKVSPEDHRAGSDVAKSSPEQAAPSASGTPASPSPRPASEAAQSAAPVVLSGIEWSPEIALEQHKRFNWPAAFQLPMDISLSAPAVPPEIEKPSAPIENAPAKGKSGWGEMLRGVF
jgi:hypothetical protein